MPKVRDSDSESIEGGFFWRVKNAFWGVNIANFNLIPFKIDIHTKILTQGYENRRRAIHKTSSTIYKFEKDLKN